ncbi:MAG: hypothetical protein LZ174_09730 [Thaumarchaeota archaeon]|jgi:hypothetical protein|nr:hypothetical protein [Candidatus Geocrenenecus arthurdayi]
MLERSKPGYPSWVACDFLEVSSHKRFHDVVEKFKHMAGDPAEFLEESDGEVEGGVIEDD